MTDAQGRQAPTDRAGHDDAVEAWAELEVGIAAYLDFMGAEDDGDHLIVEIMAPGGDDDHEEGVAPYAQFATFGEGTMLRAEVSGNAYLLPPYALGSADCATMLRAGWLGNRADAESDEQNWYVEAPLEESDELAAMVVAALRDRLGIAHPHLLTYRAWGRSVADAGVLGLTPTAEIPVDEPAAPRRVIPGRQLAFHPEDRDELAAMVSGLLRAKYDDEPEVDEDGDFVLEHMGQPVWIRARIDQPAVEIMACVARKVHSRRAASVEIGLLNRDNAWVKWTLRDRDIWQTLMLPGAPFAPAQLNAMIDVFLESMTDSRDDLAFRTGAKIV